MKQLLIALLFTSIFLPSKAQLPYILQDYEMNGMWNAGMSITSIGSNYLIAGIKGNEYNPDNKEIFIMKLDKYGNVIFRKDYNHPGDDYPGMYGNLTRMNDSTYFLFGNRSLPDTAALFMVFNKNGDTLYTKEYPGPGDNFFMGRTCTKSTNFGSNSLLALTGQVDTDEMYNVNIRLLLTEHDGTIVHDNTYEMEGHQWPFDITSTGNGYLISGYHEISTDPYSKDPLLIKTDSEGNLLWSKTYGEELADHGAFVTLADDGNYLLSTCYGEEQAGMTSVDNRQVIIKTDTEGEIIWEKKYDSVNWRYTQHEIHCLDDGSIVTVGTKATGPMNVEGFLFKASPDGDSLWQRLYHMAEWQDNWDRIYDFDTTMDKGFVTVGEVWYNWDPVNGDGQMTWVVKVDSLGETTLSTGIPNRYFTDDIEAYPNPATQYLTIDIPDFIHQPGMQLRVVSTSGRLIIKRKARPGEERINVSDWRPGLYLVEVLRNNGKVFSKKIIVR